MLVTLKALGCRLNEAELESWSNDFQSLGYSITNKTEIADIVVVNTCAVTQEAVKKSRQLIRKSHRINPKAKLIVSGCYSSLNPEITNEIETIDLVVANKNKDKLAQIVNDEINLEAMPSIATEPGESALFARGRNRAFIKVQDGCRYRCTFCIVTIARGDERSKAVSDIVNEINTLHQQGIQEAILTGVHIGGYGSDIESNLYTLIKTILAETDIPRLRLGSVEPWDLGENFFELFANPRFMPHLHLPLQSGSDSVLRRMARRCKTDDFSRLLIKACSSIADFNVTTDIIVGFPGESDEEWEENLTFVESCKFSHIHIFPYSPRQGTRAASMPDQLDLITKKTRTRQLHQLANEMRIEILKKYVGRDFPVLFENHIKQTEDGRQSYFAYTPNYLKVKYVWNEELSLKNQIHHVKLSGYDEQASHMLATSFA
ncbi:MAG: tRNA (N(6)-L-threonylcarbamoyladenosine(37)-C(2))-methylthiotransferase MtaB [Gammaproteobacteria bacterium]|jgi:threonylcarbamoyladenosine tRNA methylthiotransferase MtaB|nr:tRNA (N(6)-L-threonylcarbamoyladenosine(37)-C(2))-methylthiotransferase MtaB [Gammaproteobacteria bacterium]